MKVDNASLQNLCQQHGQVVGFIPNFVRGQVLVGYTKTEDSIKAHRQINSFRIGNNFLVAEFISESDVTQLARAQGSSGNNAFPGGMNQQAMPTGKMEGIPQWNNAGSNSFGWNGGAGGGSSGGWGDLGMEDHGMFFPGGLLGSQ